jgi:hypothetical protein
MLLSFLFVFGVDSPFNQSIINQSHTKKQKEIFQGEHPYFRDKESVSQAGSSAR